ncbi:MAG: nucleoside monophosphate kinase [bacterium]|nr:nucleoside monophosphate kinase [bacterium]
MLQTVILIGRSGCGKGTQGDLLRNWILGRDQDKNNILYVESGNNFRQFIRGENYSAKQALNIYEMDERQPDFLACCLWGQELINDLREDMHLMFDGAPRSLPESMLITSALDFFKREEPRVVYINVSREWSEEKLLARGRSDDKTLAKINKRLDWFDKDVIPAIDFFRAKPKYKFLDINGEQSIEKVHQDIISKY